MVNSDNTLEESQHEKDAKQDGSDSGGDLEQAKQPAGSLPVIARIDVGGSRGKKPKEREWINPEGFNAEEREVWEAFVEGEKRRLLSDINYSFGSSDIVAVSLSQTNGRNL